MMVALVRMVVFRNGKLLIQSGNVMMMTNYCLYDTLSIQRCPVSFYRFHRWIVAKGGLRCALIILELCVCGVRCPHIYGGKSHCALAFLSPYRVTSGVMEEISGDGARNGWP